MTTNLLSVFQTPYEITDRDGIGVQLLTGLRTSEIALHEGFRVVQDERSPASLTESHRVCTSQTDFTREQEIHLAGEGSKDSLKIGGGLNIMLKHTVTSRSVVCASFASIVTGKDTFNRTRARLTPEAARTLADDPASFVARFGTHFIGGYTLGANFNSVVEIETATTTDKMTVGARLKASYESAVKGQHKKKAASNGHAAGPGKSASGSARYGLDEETSKLISDVRGRLFATGIGMEGDISSLDDVSSALARFSSDASKHSTRITAICYPYTMLSDVSDLLREHKTPGKLLPEVDYATIDLICQESRRTLRAISMISTLDEIADGVPELQRISDRYRLALQHEMNSFRSLSLAELQNPPAHLRAAVGMAEDKAAPAGEPLSQSTEIYTKWVSEFRAAYEVI